MKQNKAGNVVTEVAIWTSLGSILTLSFYPYIGELSPMVSKPLENYLSIIEFFIGAFTVIIFANLWTFTGTPEDAEKRKSQYEDAKDWVIKKTRQPKWLLKFKQTLLWISVLSTGVMLGDFSFMAWFGAFGLFAIGANKAAKDVIKREETQANAKG